MGMGHAVRLRLVWIALAGVVAWGSADRVEASKASSIKIEKTYKGRMNVGSLDPQTMKAIVDETPRVISNQEEYDAFVGRIPKKEISKTKPAPASKDPLLAKPKIDFKKRVMAVVIRGDNMYESPEIQGVFVESQRTIVRFGKAAANQDVMAQPLEVGAYTAIVFKKPKHPISFEAVPAK